MKNKLSIYTLWCIGRKAYYNKNNYSNIIEKYSNFYSYYYGNSYLFSRENIRKMVILYLNFPIYYDQLEKVNWEQYGILLSVSNKIERYFYFKTLLFFKDNDIEISTLINSNIYTRI